MEKLTFSLVVDLPLATLTLVAFLWHFNYWSKNANFDDSISIEKRLPTARARVIALMLGLVLLFWFANVALWPFYVLLIIVGMTVGIVANADLAGTNLALFFGFVLVREWAFGFPQLILHPPTNELTERPDKPKSELDGTCGVAVSPLRPCGEAMIGGIKLSVVSEDGTFIEQNSKIVVVGKRNSRVAVRVFED